MYLTKWKVQKKDLGFEMKTKVKFPTRRVWENTMLKILTNSK